MNQRTLWTVSTAATAALLFAPRPACAQRASVQLRARSDRGASVVACRGDQLTSWLLSAQDAPAVEWDIPARCAPGAFVTLDDGGVLFIDAENPALVRLSAEGVERYRAPLASAGWGAPQLLGSAVVLRTSGGTVEWRALDDGQLRFYRRTEAAADRRALLTDGGPMIVRQSSGERVCVAHDHAIECWRASDGLSLTEYARASMSALCARPLPVDLDGDGDDELVIASADAAVSAVDKRGAVRWSHASPTRALVTAQPVAFALRGALRVAWTDMDRWVIAVRAGDGAAVATIARRVDAVSRAGLRVADVDGDAEPDLLVSARSGALFAFGARDGSSTALIEPSAAPAAIEGEPLLLAGSDGAVQWLALGADHALWRRSFAPSALRESEALLVAQPDARPSFAASASVVSHATASASVTAASAPSAAVAPSRAGGCSARAPASSRHASLASSALALAGLLCARRRPRRSAT